MLSRTELDQFTKTCIGIANELADEHGFVAARELLKRFQAQLYIRPLLVEGMLAKAEGAENPWAVLIDSETHSISFEQVENERFGKPLPDRVRNTIAHELVHSLAFRVEEFGIRLRRPTDSDKSYKALVEDIEQKTESLSPYLLLPYETLTKAVRDQKSPLSIERLMELRKAHGISRFVLVGRLRRLPPADKNLVRPGLRNIAIGIGEWRGRGEAVLRKWPLFMNFDDNIAPAFLVRLLAGKAFLPAGTAFPEGLLASASSSSEAVSDFECEGGTSSLPDSHVLQVRVALERKQGRTFLFVIHSLGRERNKKRKHVHGPQRRNPS